MAFISKSWLVQGPALSFDHDCDEVEVQIAAPRGKWAETKSIVLSAHLQRNYVTSNSHHYAYRALYLTEADVLQMIGGIARMSTKAFRARLHEELKSAGETTPRRQ